MDGRINARKPTSDNGYPAEHIAKHIDEHHADPEGRKGHAYQRQHHAGRVDPSIGLHAGKNSKHEPNRQADSKTAEGQFEGRTGLLENHASDGLTCAEGFSQVTTQGLAEKAHVALRHGPIEAKARPFIGTYLLRRRHSGEHQIDRIARDNLKDDEDHGPGEE